MTYFPLTIIIPCKDEGESIYAVIKEIQNILVTAKIDFEIIVVNNNSIDNTRSEAEKIGQNVRVIDCTVPGYGASILEGIKYAKNDIVCMLDGDGSYNPKDIPVLLRLYSQSFHSDKRMTLCMGNRFSNGNSKNIKFLHRFFGVPMLNFLTNKLYGAQESIDSHCGLRLFNKKLVQELHVSHTDFSFANEMICKALKQKYQINQTPITLRKDFRMNNISKIKMFSDGYYALKTILMIRISKT